MYKILIVEDHDTLGYVLVEYLKLHSFDAYWEPSAEAGLERLKSDVPHLCLLDISLPKMDGFELAKKDSTGAPRNAPHFFNCAGAKGG